MATVTLIGSMSPWVLPKGTLGTVGYTRTYLGNCLLYQRVPCMRPIVPWLCPNVPWWQSVIPECTSPLPHRTSVWSMWLYHVHTADRQKLFITARFCQFESVRISILSIVYRSVLALENERKIFLCAHLSVLYISFVPTNLYIFQKFVLSKLLKVTQRTQQCSLLAYCDVICGSNKLK
jgi:hypothetical protein